VQTFRFGRNQLNRECDTACPTWQLLGVFSFRDPVNNQTQTRAKTLHLLISSYAVTKNYAEKLQKALWYLLIIMRPTVTTVKNWLKLLKCGQYLCSFFSLIVSYNNGYVSIITQRLNGFHLMLTSGRVTFRLGNIWISAVRFIWRLLRQDFHMWLH